MSHFQNLGKQSPFLASISAQTRADQGVIDEGNKDEPNAEIAQQAFFESIEDDALLEAISEAADVNARSDGMAAVVEWVDDGDPSEDALDALAQGIADVDPDVEENEEVEVEAYEQSLYEMANAMVDLGVDSDVAMSAIGGDDAMASKAYAVAQRSLDGSSKSVSERIAEFAVSEKLMAEAVQKVVRDGKVTYINKPLKKKRLTAKQKAALARARRKAHSATANAKRKRSMSKRDKSGL